MEDSPGETMQAYFAEVTDLRVERTKLHGLVDILVIAICAVICGANTWVEIEAYGNAKEQWLRQFLALPHGIPSHDSFGRVFARLKLEVLQRCFLHLIQAVREVTIDGKTLRRSLDQAVGKGTIRMVSAWASANGVVLGQQKVAEKSNEIIAIPALLRLLEIKGALSPLMPWGVRRPLPVRLWSRKPTTC